jgi:hypothetical protein
VNLTPHPHLVPRLRMGGAVTPLPKYNFVAWCKLIRTNFSLCWRCLCSEMDDFVSEIPLKLPLFEFPLCYRILVEHLIRIPLFRSCGRNELFYGVRLPIHGRYRHPLSAVYLTYSHLPFASYGRRPPVA